LHVAWPSQSYPLGSAGEHKKATFPNGANQLIELKEQTVKRLFGTVLVGFGNSDPAGNVVVERGGTWIFRKLFRKDL
jgi:hypothetical protein